MPRRAIGDKPMTPTERSARRRKSQAEEIRMLRSMLRRAMEHGVNGNAHYHALRASDLGDEINAYLKDHST